MLLALQGGGCRFSRKKRYVTLEWPLIIIDNRRKSFKPIRVNMLYVRLSSITVASPNGLDSSSTFSRTTTTSSTTVRLPSGATTERAPTNEVYLWLPLIVVVIFTGIMVTLIMVGRRGEENPYDQTSGIKFLLCVNRSRSSSIRTL